MRVVKLTNHARRTLFICDNLSFSPDWGSSGSVKHVVQVIYT
jgi:hypothetical protein